MLRDLHDAIFEIGNRLPREWDLMLLDINGVRVLLFFLLGGLEIVHGHLIPKLGVDVFERALHDQSAMAKWQYMSQQLTLQVSG